MYIYLIRFCVYVLVLKKINLKIKLFSFSFLQGSGLLNSTVLQGMVFKRSVEGSVTKSDKSKIAIFSCPLDSLQTETKVRPLPILFLHLLKVNFTTPTR